MQDNTELIERLPQPWTSSPNGSMYTGDGGPDTAARESALTSPPPLKHRRLDRPVHSFGTCTAGPPKRPSWRTARCPPGPANRSISSMFLEDCRSQDDMWHIEARKSRNCGSRVRSHDFRAADLVPSLGATYYAARIAHSIHNISHPINSTRAVGIHIQVSANRLGRRR